MWLGCVINRISQLAQNPTHPKRSELFLGIGTQPVFCLLNDGR